MATQQKRASRKQPTDRSVTDRPSPVRRLVPFKQALRYGHWGKNKAYQLIHAGKIKAYKDGRQTLVDLDTIDAYKNSLPPIF